MTWSGDIDEKNALTGIYNLTIIFTAVRPTTFPTRQNIYIKKIKTRAVTWNYSNLCFYTAEKEIATV